MNFKPNTIYIDIRSRSHALTRKIVRHFPSVPCVYVKSIKEFIKNENRKTNAITEGKKVLFLTVYKGTFLKKCPGTHNYICCGYQILHTQSQCTLDCAYCILQSYFNNPLITLFTNTRDLFKELNHKIDAHPKRLWRIGTGEFSDSLILDDLTGSTISLIPFFIKKKNAILELKTKTDNIQNLLRFKPQGNIIVAWSLNAPRIVKKYEKNAASLNARFRAAHACQARGYKIAFHFDPLFHYPGWEKEYKAVVDRLFSSVRPESIAWISLGCFRYMPQLKGIIEKRFSRFPFIYDECIIGFDGKMRYPKPLRIHMYTKMISWIIGHNSNVFIYLCMESNEVWKRSFGYTPCHFGSLKHGLDSQIFS